jgi:eukaryotic-like serine/threonine-protein kinase
MGQAPHEFTEADSCIMGRADDCPIRLPNDAPLISRHHCLLDINPPDMRIRDFGSLNGTYVNGERIGQRPKGMSPDKAKALSFPERDLKDGDEIRLGDTVFRVGIQMPAVCVECSTEIPDHLKAQAERSPGVFRCEPCHRKGELANRREAPRPKPRVCASCGRDVGAEAGANRHGDFICASCKANPLHLVNLLLRQANQGVAGVQQIQGYTIEKTLGEGGMGLVWLARHERTGERVALKVMLPKIPASARAKDSFLREVELTKALIHPNIVGFRESGCSNGAFFLTLEFCVGGSVDKLMVRRGGKLPVQEAMPILFEVLDGLEYAHRAPVRAKLADGTYAEANGLVHRDLSPHNILLSEVAGRQVAKVSDFGLSKAFDTAGLSGQTRSGTVAGKPWYMPRQQVIQFKYAKPDVDVWAAAACLYNMLTGAFPRDFRPRRDVWQTVLQSQPVPILQRNPHLPRRLAEVIDRALVDQSDIAFKSAAALKQALQAAL